MKQISFAQVLIDAFKILLEKTFYKLKLGLTPRLICPISDITVCPQIMSSAGFVSFVHFKTLTITPPKPCNGKYK